MLTSHYPPRLPVLRELFYPSAALLPAAHPLARVKTPAYSKGHPLLSSRGTMSAPEVTASIEVTLSLPELRRSIDNIDSAILTLLAERFKITNRIGALKQKLSLPAVDPAREASQRQHVRATARTLGLDPDFAENLWRLVVNQVVHNHLQAGPE